MSEYTLRFLASQAADTIVFSGPADAHDPTAAGNFGSWHMPSFRLTDTQRLDELEADGGLWIGNVWALPGNIFNMVASYFPVSDQPDHI